MASQPLSVAVIFQNPTYGPAPESAQPALAWLEAHHRSFGHFIAGRWTTPDPQRQFETVNPANGQPLARVTQADAEEVNAAVAAAREAFTAWSQTPGHIRARYLYAMARQIQKHARLFAVLESLDNGKPIRETREIDIPLAARHFYHHAGWAQLMDSALAGYAPLGVVGQIIPWNFPLLMLAWKIAPALAMGNTVVLKPAEWTPLTALRFAELCQAIGLPPGVVNIITGDGQVGQMLVNHPDVDKIAFTGSTEVGRAIRIATAGSGKRLSLELGGKSPFIVFDDADLDGAIEGVVDAIWFNQGQVCCAGSRLLVHEGIAQRFTTGCARAWRSCGWATRWTKRWTWGRSSPHPNSRRSPAWWNKARPRARRSGSRAGLALARATSIHRPSSRTSHRRRRLRRKRSSGRCW